MGGQGVGGRGVGGTTENTNRSLLEFKIFFSHSCAQFGWKRRPTASRQCMAYLETVRSMAFQDPTKSQKWLYKKHGDQLSRYQTDPVPTSSLLNTYWY